MMQTEQFISRLANDLQPVRRRTASGDALVLAVLLGIELALMLAFGAVRPDMPEVVGSMAFWWKAVSLAIVTVLTAGAALLSLDPSRSPRGALRWTFPVMALFLATGWMIDASHEGWPSIVQRLDLSSGPECAMQIFVLSLPAIAVLGMLMRRGASTDVTGSALAAGLAAAGWGAFAFVFYCPYDDPLYVVTWYGLGCGAVTLTTCLVLPRLVRW